MAVVTGSVVGATAAAGKLAGLTKALTALNPFTWGGALKLGTGLTAAGMLAGVPSAVEQNILSQGKVGGKYQTGLLAGALDLLDGEGTRFTQEGLANTAYKNLLESNIAASAMQDGFRAPKPGESEGAYSSAYAKWTNLPSTKGTKALQDPLFQLQLNQQRAENLRAHERELRGLRAQEMQIEGNLATARMQLAGAQDLNQQRLHNYAEDMRMKRENERYATTAGLVGGLGALTSAFLL